MKPILECKGLSKKYNKSAYALHNLNLTLNHGQIVGLLGPNGSGKTTLIKLINGLLTPSEGELYIDQNPVGIESKKIVSYLPDHTYLESNLKVREIIDYFKDFYDDFDEDRMYGLLDRMELHFDGKVRNMSTGMLAKLKVAVAMARNSRVILLDEPLNGIDIIAREQVMNTITGYNNEDKIIIVSSHLVDELEHAAGGAVFIKNGRVVMAGNTEDIRSYNDDKSLVDLYKEIYGGMYNGQTY